MLPVMVDTHAITLRGYSSPVPELEKNFQGGEGGTRSEEPAYGRPSSRARIEEARAKLWW